MSAFRRVIGSFRMLRRRVQEVRQPGLTMWANTGEASALALQRTVRDGSHRAETRALNLEQDLRSMLADGKIDSAEFKRLAGAPGCVHTIAEQCHDLGEAVS